MPQSLSSIVVHLVFSTKNRTAWLTPEIRDELFQYLVGILKKIDCAPIKVGGYIEHVHLVFALPRTRTIAQVVEETKIGSSKWLKTKGIPHFAWQVGYAVFSISKSDLDSVVEYVQNQVDHHRELSFMDEFRGLMKENDIEIDERYVWD